MIRKTLVINGVTRNLVLCQDETLATVLREHLLLTGCKIGCGEGHCGACNVIMNGKVTKACIVKMSKVPDNAEITTIEGVGTISDMHPLQVAWMAFGCAQCGFCTPGFIISAKVLLEQNPNPTREEVRDWFNKTRNLCRCTGYKPLVDAVMDAAAVLRGEMSKEDLIFKPTGDSIKGTQYIHSHPAAQTLAWRAKGAEKVVLITDMIRPSGLPDGRYPQADGSEFVVSHNGTELRLPSGVLAGSALTMERGLRNFTANAGASLDETWRCASLNPARLIGIDSETGSIERGKLADLVLIDNEFNVVRTIIEGKTVWKK